MHGNGYVTSSAASWHYRLPRHKHLIGFSVLGTLYSSLLHYFHLNILKVVCLNWGNVSVAIRTEGHNLLYFIFLPMFFKVFLSVPGKKAPHAVNVSLLIL